MAATKQTNWDFGIGVPFGPRGGSDFAILSRGRLLQTAVLLMAGQEPGRFFVAVSIRGKHDQIRFRRIIQIQHTFSLCGDGAEIPAGGVHPDDFTGGLESSRLGQVAFAIRSAAETEKPAIGRPIDVINLVGLVFDAQAPVTHCRLIRIEIDGSSRNFVIAGAPGDLLPVWTQAGAAAGYVQVDDIGSMRFDQQYAMIDAHARVDCRNDPLPVTRPARVVQMMQVRRIDVWLDFAGRQIVKVHSAGVEIHHVEFRKLLRQKADDLAIGTPERLTRMIDQLLAMAAIDIHDIKTADRISALAFINGKADFAPVGGNLRVMLVLLRGPGQVNWIRPVRIHDENFPVIIDISLIGDLEGSGLQSLAERVVRLTRGCSEDDYQQECGNYEKTLSRKRPRLLR